MHPNPNKFLMLVFSVIPGAGHMYLGLMKRGVTFLFAFAASIAGVGMFNFISLFQYAFGLLIPLIWFVAFFDFWRYPRMLPEEKAAVKDAYLIPGSINLSGSFLTRKVRMGAGIVLVLAGVVQLYNNVFYWYVMDLLHSERVKSFFGDLPTLLGGLAIIVVGFLLIFWKGRQVKKETAYPQEVYTYDEE